MTTYEPQKPWLDCRGPTEASEARPRLAELAGRAPQAVWLCFRVPGRCRDLRPATACIRQDKTRSLRAAAAIMCLARRHTRGANALQFQITSQASEAVGNPPPPPLPGPWCSSAMGPSVPVQGALQFQELAGAPGLRRTCPFG
jgi:hypothetical protein